MLVATHLAGFGAEALVETVITSQGTNTGSPPAAWLDGVYTGSTSGAFVTNYGKDFGSPRQITRLTIYGATTRGTCTNTATGSLFVEYSTDNSSWFSAGSHTDVPNCHQANWVAQVTITAPAARYWRWQCTNSFGDSSIFLAESEWRGY